MQNKTPGQLAYEEDLCRKPFYPSGDTRKTWAQLGDIERLSWEREPTPRNWN